jgi:Na+/proline symporter
VLSVPAAWWRLSKATNSTSIADFIASRFGKSSLLAATVTGVAVLGIVPYISLQLKAVAMSFGAMTLGRPSQERLAAWQDLAFYVALLMAMFAMLFGTRRASATEHNRGLVLAMGFESCSSSPPCWRSALSWCSACIRDPPR